MPTIIPTTDIVEHPESHGYDGYIDNVLFRMAVTPETPLEDTTAEANPPRVDTAQFAEDVRDEVGRRYSRSNLSGGAGLDYLHSPLRPEDAEIRFWDSKGVDVFSQEKGEAYGVKLARKFRYNNADLGFGQIFFIWGSIAECRGAIWWYDDTGVVLVTEGPPGTVLGGYGIGSYYIDDVLSGARQMISMGNSLYLRNRDDGVKKVEVPHQSQWDFDFEASLTIISSVDYDYIWAAKSRILGVIDNLLYEVEGDTLILTLPTGETVTDVVDAGPAVLVFSTTGTIHSLTLDQSLNLVPAGESTFADSEIPIFAVETFGVIGIATSQPSSRAAGGAVARFYTASLDLSGGYELTDIQLIYQVGDGASTVDHSPLRMLASRDSIYMAVRSDETSEFEIDIWRYYLPTGGYARAHTIRRNAGDPENILNFGDTVKSMALLNDRLFVHTTDNILGDLEPWSWLWEEVEEYVTDGYFIGPLADFFTEDSKQWVGASLTGGAMPLGTGLELYHTVNQALITDPDSTSWELVTSLSLGETQREEASLAGVDGRYHAAKVILRSDSSRLLSSEWRSYSFRALPNPDRDILLRVPINVSDQVESPGRRAVIIRGRGEDTEQALRAYECEHVIIKIFRPLMEVRGLVEKFEKTIAIMPNRGSASRVMYARIRGTRLSIATVSDFQTDGISLGQDIMGVTKLGVGDPTT